MPDDHAEKSRGGNCTSILKDKCFWIRWRRPASLPDSTAMPGPDDSAIRKPPGPPGDVKGQSFVGVPPLLTDKKLSSQEWPQPIVLSKEQRVPVFAAGRGRAVHVGGVQYISE